MDNLSEDTDIPYMNGEGKLYAADSLNNLSKLNAFTGDSQDLLFGLEEHFGTEKKNGSDHVNGNPRDREEAMVPKRAKLKHILFETKPHIGNFQDVEETVTHLGKKPKGDAQESQKNASPQMRNLLQTQCICLVLLTVTFLVSLALTVFAIFLIVHKSDQLYEKLSKIVLEAKEVEEIRKMNTLILQYFNQTLLSMGG